MFSCQTCRMSQGVPAQPTNSFEGDSTRPDAPLDVDTVLVTRRANVVATLALVFGLVAVPLSWVPVVGLFTAGPLGLAAVVCGLVGARRAGDSGRVLALTGLVIGVVALMMELMTTLLSLT